jgi:hypothetical protein
MEDFFMYRDVSRVKQVLWEALYDLVGSAPIDVRLHDVWLKIMTLREDDTPEEIVDDFALVKHRLSPNQNLTADEANEVGQKILSMYTKLNGGI